MSCQGILGVVYLSMKSAHGGREEIKEKDIEMTEEDRKNRRQVRGIVSDMETKVKQMFQVFSASPPYFKIRFRE